MASRLVEDFENELDDYTGSLSDFSITTSPYGANCLAAASASLGTSSIITREFPSRTLSSFSAKFNITSIEDNDACIVKLRQDLTVLLSFNPCVNGGTDSLRRAAITLEGETLYASPVLLEEDNWYTIYVSIVPGAGNSRFVLYQTDGAVEVLSGNFANDHTQPTANTLTFDLVSGDTTSATLYDDVSVNPDTTEVPEGIPPFMSVTHAFERKGIFTNTAMAQGSARKRRRYTSVPPVYQVTWDLSQEQMTKLDNWYEFDLLAGSETFDVEIAVPGGVEKHNAQWVEPYTATPNEIERWVVTGKILIDGAAGRGQVAPRIPLNYVASIYESASASDWSLAAWPVSISESTTANATANWAIVELFLVEEHASAADASNTLSTNKAGVIESSTPSSTQVAGWRYLVAIAESVTSSDASDGGVSNPYLANTTGLWGAYSMSRIISGYSGNCVKVRRSSDNSTQDIGFTGDDLDVSALMTFVGGSPASDAYIDTWYDQSGGSNDLAQATTGYQPLLVDAGVLQDMAYFDGVDDYLQTANSGTNPVTAYSVHYAGRGRAGPGTPVSEFLFTNGVLAASQFSWPAGFDTGLRYSVFTEAGSLSYEQHVGGYNHPSVEDSTVNSLCSDRSGSLVTDELKVYVDGDIGSPQLLGGSAVSTNGTPGQMTVGMHSSAAYWARLAVRTFLAYEVAHSQPDTAALAAQIKYKRAPGGLDGFTNGLWGAWSLRKLVSAYSGPCMKVRRDSDDTTQDIGFAADGMYDITAIVTFSGGTASCYVDTLYDQSGGGNHVVAPNNSAQPVVVYGGVPRLYMDFDYSDDRFVSVNNSGTPSAFTTFVRARQDAYGTTQWPVHDPTFSAFFSWYFDGGGSPYRIAAQLNNGAGGVIDNTYPTFNSGGVVAMKVDRAASGAAKIRCYSGGAEIAATNRTNTGSITGNFPAAPWQFGGATNAPTCFLHTWVVYEAALSDADIDRVSRVLG